MSQLRTCPCELRREAVRRHVQHERAGAHRALDGLLRLAPIRPVMRVERRGSLLAIERPRVLREHVAVIRRAVEVHDEPRRRRRERLHAEPRAERARNLERAVVEPAVRVEHVLGAGEQRRVRGRHLVAAVLAANEQPVFSAARAARTARRSRALRRAPHIPS